MKGVLHVHSTFSDGELSLRELREIYTRLGYRFACLTDHAEYFDDAAIVRYIAESRDLSDEVFRFIPGLEYECPDRMHILGLGTTQLIRTRDPGQVIREIESTGGISVIAHPRTQDFARVEALAGAASGIEVWNSKYDGRYAPRTETFALARRVRARHERVCAYFGQDLHFRKQYTGLHVELPDTALQADPVLAALRHGRFVAKAGAIELGTDGELAPAVGARFDRWHRRSRQLRRVAGTAKGILESLGVAVPPRVKMQLRRLF